MRLILGVPLGIAFYAILIRLCWIQGWREISELFPRHPFAIARLRPDATNVWLRPSAEHERSRLRPVLTSENTQTVFEKHQTCSTSVTVSAHQCLFF